MRVCATEARGECRPRDVKLLKLKEKGPESVRIDLVSIIPKKNQQKKTSVMRVCVCSGCVIHFNILGRKCES